MFLLFLKSENGNQLKPINQARELRPSYFVVCNASSHTNGTGEIKQQLKFVLLQVTSWGSYHLTGTRTTPASHLASDHGLMRPIFTRSAHFSLSVEASLGIRCAVKWAWFTARRRNEPCPSVLFRSRTFLVPWKRGRGINRRRLTEKRSNF